MLQTPYLYCFRIPPQKPLQTKSKSYFSTLHVFTFKHLHPEERAPNYPHHVYCGGGGPGGMGGIGGLGGGGGPP